MTLKLKLAQRYSRPRLPHLQFFCCRNLIILVLRSGRFVLERPIPEFTTPRVTPGLPLEAHACSPR